MANICRECGKEYSAWTWGGVCPACQRQKEAIEQRERHFQEEQRYRERMEWERKQERISEEIRRSSERREAERREEERREEERRAEKRREEERREAERREEKRREEERRDAERREEKRREEERRYEAERRDEEERRENERREAERRHEKEQEEKRIAEEKEREYIASLPHCLYCGKRFEENNVSYFEYCSKKCAIEDLGRDNAEKYYERCENEKIRNNFISLKAYFSEDKYIQYYVFPNSETEEKFNTIITKDMCSREELEFLTDFRDNIYHAFESKMSDFQTFKDILKTNEDLHYYKFSNKDTEEQVNAIISKDVCSEEELKFLTNFAKDIHSVFIEKISSFQTIKEEIKNNEYFQYFKFPTKDSEEIFNSIISKDICTEEELLFLTAFWNKVYPTFEQSTRNFQTLKQILEKDDFFQHYYRSHDKDTEERFNTILSKDVCSNEEGEFLNDFVYNIYPRFFEVFKKFITIKEKLKKDKYFQYYRFPDKDTEERFNTIISKDVCSEEELDFLTDFEDDICSKFNYIMGRFSEFKKMFEEDEYFQYYKFPDKDTEEKFKAIISKDVCTEEELKFLTDFWNDIYSGFITEMKQFEHAKLELNRITNNFQNLHERINAIISKDISICSKEEREFIKKYINNYGKVEKVHNAVKKEYNFLQDFFQEISKIVQTEIENKNESDARVKFITGVFLFVLIPFIPTIITVHICSCFLDFGPFRFSMVYIFWLIIYHIKKGNKVRSASFNYNILVLYNKISNLIEDNFFKTTYQYLNNVDLFNETDVDRVIKDIQQKASTFPSKNSVTQFKEMFKDKLQKK